MATKKKAEQEPNFEKDLESLEKIVEALEEGGLSLDVSIKKFEEGMRLAQRCDKALGAAEKKIELLTRNTEGELETQPFGDDDESAASSARKPKSKAEDGSGDEDDEDEDEEEEGDGALLF